MRWLFINQHTYKGVRVSTDSYWRVCLDRARALSDLGEVVAVVVPDRSGFCEFDEGMLDGIRTIEMAPPEVGICMWMSREQILSMVKGVDAFMPDIIVNNAPVLTPQYEALFGQVSYPTELS